MVLLRVDNLLLRRGLCEGHFYISVCSNIMEGKEEAFSCDIANVHFKLSLSFDMQLKSD